MMGIEDDDDMLLLPLPSEGYKASLKALQTITNKSKQRKAKQQEAQEKVARQQEDLQAVLETLGAEDDDLEEQQMKLEAMQAMVQEELGKGDEEAGGPEPEIFMEALPPVQALPVLQLQAVPQLQAVLQLQQELLAAPDGAADTTTPAPTTAGSSTGDPAHLSEAFAWLLAEGGGLQVCPSEAVARITFQAVCYGSKGLSLAAFNRFMAWCGEPEIVAGSQLSTLSQVYQWSGGAFTRPPNSTLAACTSLADSLPPTTITWLPSADDVLDALTAMGLRPQQQQQQGQQQQQMQQQQQQGQEGEGLAYRHGNLPLLLQLLARLCRAHTAGRLDMAGLAANQGRYLQLLLSLLALMLDERALVTCRCVLPEAFAAVLEVPPATAWDRLIRDTGNGNLLEAVSGGLGPSYRSAAHLLAQMPRSTRGRALRQLGAVQLLAKLVKEKPQAPPSRISGMEAGALRASLHSEVKRLLGRPDKLRALLVSLSQPPEPGGKLQVWSLVGVLEAADLVLWVDVSTPGIGISSELREWFLQWLTELDKVLAKKLNNHRATAKVAEMANAYRFAACGCVVVS